VGFAECKVIEVVRGINGGWEDSIRKIIMGKAHGREQELLDCFNTTCWRRFWLGAERAAKAD
jgi:hypothetical protein